GLSCQPLNSQPGRASSPAVSALHAVPVLWHTTPSRMTAPAVMRLTPLVNMLARGREALSCMVVVERTVRTTPHTSSTRALSSSTTQSEKPPLFSSSIWFRLRMQFMSWIAELSSCFRSTSKARRQSVVPTASRHSPDRLLHKMDFLGSLNHHSSTCSSRITLSRLQAVLTAHSRGSWHLSIKSQCATLLSPSTSGPLYNPPSLPPPACQGLCVAPPHQCASFSPLSMGFMYTLLAPYHPRLVPEDGWVGCTSLDARSDFLDILNNGYMRLLFS
uniref:Uncharacterized protein n=1 Tax=Gopherus agassizii TaxID=38772 RepID=A0A452IGK4_9SAUR